MDDRAQLFRTEALQQRSKSQHGCLLEGRKQYSTLLVYCSLMLPVVMLLLVTLWYANSGTGSEIVPALIRNSIP